MTADTFRQAGDVAADVLRWLVGADWFAATVFVVLFAVGSLAAVLVGLWLVTGG